MAAYVAYQQYRTARDKLRLDLYDRRLQIYSALIDCLRGIVSARDLTPEELNGLVRALEQKSTEVPFLFGREVREFVAELYGRSARLSVVRVLAVGPLARGPAADEAFREMDSILDWMVERINAAEAIFRPYLSFTHLRGSKERQSRSWLTRRCSCRVCRDAPVRPSALSRLGRVAPRRPAAELGR